MGRHAPHRTLTILSLLLASCGGTPAALSSHDTSAPLSFELDSIDQRPVTSAAIRGQRAALVFIQTGNLKTQHQVTELNRLFRERGPIARCYLIAIEPREHRELVEIFSRTLGVPCPTGILDPGRTGPSSPFASLGTLPAVWIVGPEGRVQHRHEGKVMLAHELASALERDKQRDSATH